MTDAEWRVIDSCGSVLREAVYRLDPQLLLCRPGYCGRMIERTVAEALLRQLRELIQEYKAPASIAGAATGEPLCIPPLTAAGEPIPPVDR